MINEIVINLRIFLLAKFGIPVMLYMKVLLMHISAFIGSQVAFESGSKAWTIFKAKIKPQMNNIFMLWMLILVKT